MYYVYAIINDTGNYRYVGMTCNLRKRLSDHNKGKTRSTKPYRPFTKIIELGSFNTRTEARKTEKYYKSGVGREELDRIMRQ